MARRCHPSVVIAAHLPGTAVDRTVNDVPATSARRLSREDRRAHFIDVAARLILERGVESVTMESVAAAAGVSKGLGYAYFDNRADLLMAVLDREMTANESRVAEAMATATDFEGKIRGAVGAWFDTVAERGALLGPLLNAGQIRGALEKRRRTRLRRWEAFYGRLAADELGIPEPQAVAAAAILLAGLSGVLDRWVIGKDPRRLLEETFVELAMRGLQGLASTVP